MISNILVLLCVSALTMANPYMVPTFNLERASHDCKLELNIETPKESPRSLSSPLNYSFFNSSYACLNKCILEKSRIYSVTGEYNTSSIPADFADLGKECNRLSLLSSTTWDCDRAHNFTVCMIKSFGMLFDNIIRQCAIDTNTNLDTERAYTLIEFQSKKSYNCLNRCISMTMGKMDENNNIKLHLVQYFAPPNANVAVISETCDIEVDHLYHQNICKYIVKHEMCVNKELIRLTEIWFNQ